MKYYSNREMTDENSLTSNIGTRASDELRSIETTAVFSSSPPPQPPSSASVPATAATTITSTITNTKATTTTTMKTTKTPTTTTTMTTTTTATPKTTDSIDENGKDTMKYGFWQNLINFRENMSKGASVIPLSSPSDGSDSSSEIKLPRHSVKSCGSGGRRKFGADDDDGDCISELIGHTGLWQFTWSIILILFQVPPAFHIFAFVFQAVERDFWCAPPDHIDISNMSISMAEWRNLSQPNGACEMVNMTGMTIDDLINWTRHNNHTLDMVKCERFQFDSTLSETTIQSEWDVVCDKATLLSVIEMCFLGGAATGSLSSGVMSDEYGRRHSLMLFVALQAVIGTSLGLVQSLIPSMILRFTMGFVCMSMVNISFVLAVEMVTGKWSTIIGILDLLPIPLSYMLIAGIAYVTRNWRDLQLIVSSPWFGLLLFWYFLPESPRWLLTKGRIEELKEIIETAAKWNNRTLPLNYEKMLIPPGEELSSGSFADLFKGVYLRTTLMLIIAWYALVLQYMAMTLHISEMGGNLYVITTYAGLMESIAILLSIYTVLKYGIQRNIFCLVLIAGIFCLYIALFPNTEWSIIVTMAMMVKSATGVANAVIPTFTTFQYPPTLRTRAMGIANFSAGFALVSVPYIWLLKYVLPYLPPLLLGICGIIGAIALFFIEDRTAIMMSADRHVQLHRDIKIQTIQTG